MLHQLANIASYIRKLNQSMMFVIC